MSLSVVPNVKFEIDDIEEEWTYSQPFDYIHSRFMTSSISSWKEYLTKCYEYVIRNFKDIFELSLHSFLDLNRIAHNMAAISPLEAMLNSKRPRWDPSR